MVWPAQSTNVALHQPQFRELLQLLHVVHFGRSPNYSFSFAVDADRMPLQKPEAKLPPDAIVATFGCFPAEFLWIFTVLCASSGIH